MRISDWSSDVCSSDLTRASRWSIRLSWALPRRAARTSAATTTAARTTTASRRSSASDPLALPDHEKPRFGGVFFGSSPKSGERRPDLEEEVRSEEHTSELQSLMRISYAVFCLKKKKKNKTNYNTHTN